MDKLNFPVIKGLKPNKKILSMDEYLEFVTFNLKYTVDREAVRRWKRKLRVNVPFVIK
ncbi:MAG: hypothetical protein HQL30_05000 [Candidatus Omnitrophica bacterium]|nr:hypothetical protein [Candidatus Omnitrophota bacterium]